MKVNTTRFGVLEIDDSSVIRMPRGPLGFDEQTDYCLIQHRPDTNFRWMQSIDEPGLAFVVVDASDFFENYEIEIPDAEAERIHLESAEDAIALLVVTIGDQGREITANLAAPIVLNSRELIGLQVVLQDNRFPVKHPLGTKIEKPDQPTTSDSEAAVAAKAA